MDHSSTSVGYELSISQKDLWSQHNPPAVCYNQIVIRIKGSLDRSGLKSALLALIAKHEALAFRCSMNAGSLFPWQCPTGAAEMDWLDGTEETGLYTKAEEAAYASLDRPYDPTADSPLRMYLTSISRHEHYLFIRLYALWGDTYSLFLLFGQLYERYRDAADDTASQGIIEYHNFSQWQNDLQQDPAEEGNRFWAHYKYVLRRNVIPFETRTGASFLPGRIKLDTFERGRYEAMKTLCVSMQAGMEDLLLGVFGSFMALYTEEKLTIGYIPFRRNYEELNATLGLISRTLPVTFTGSEAKTVVQAVSSLRTAVQEVKDWSDYFHLGAISGNHGEVRLPFLYCFEYIRPDGGTDECFEMTDLYSVAGSFLIKVVCIDDGHGISLWLYYDRNKLGLEAVDIIAAQLRHCYQLPDKMGASGKDIRKIDASNDTNGSFDTSVTVMDLFHKQAEEAPGNIALIYGEEEITYGMLRHQVDQLSHYLSTHYGLGQGDIVGIALDRSPWMVISILSVMYSGATYVPIDTEYPLERISYILKDSGACLLIGEERFLPSEVQVCCPMREGGLPYEEVPYGQSYLTLHPDRPAYIIYTSGSTGRPKGCVISHHNLSNYIQWANKYYFGKSDGGNWGLFTSIAFDLTVTCLFTSLTRGKRLVIAENNEELTAVLERCCNDPRIDTLKLTPSHLSILKNLTISRTSLRTVICGGEQLTREQVNAVWQINEDVRVYNEYGPTETTVGVIVKEIKKQDERILIGQPIANTRVYILNDTGDLTPVGVTGEIYIGGEAVGEGYWQRGDLTAEKFLVDPFNKHWRMYRTGDMGRWLPDGNIEYIGRRDDQVKIRGFRIELGEVENTIVGHPGIDAAAVISRADNEGNNELVAYIVGKDSFNQPDLQRYLGRLLPAHMVPGSFIRMERLPLTPNGKVDKKRLPELHSPEHSAEREYTAPRDITEAKLISIWEEILDRKKIGALDSFLELGGHSLKATRLVSRIYKEFQVKLTLKELLTADVLTQQAKLIRHRRTGHLTPVTPVEQQPDYPLSSSQRRLWTLSQTEEGNIAYTMPGSYVFEGELNVAALEKTLNSLLQRHESLRTVFREDDKGEVRQHILPLEEMNFRLSRHDITEELSTPFDLATGPLIRAGLYQTEEDKWVFSFVIHHIISDGWSMEVLVGELSQFYNGYINGEEYNPQPLRIHYKDYAVWQQQQLQTGLTAHKDYWLQQLKGPLQVIDLPADKPRPPVKTYNSDAVHVAIDPVLSRAVRTLTMEQGSTLFMGLLAAVDVLLFRYTHQTDLIIGSPIAGRDHPDLEDQIGFYVNTLPLRVRFSGQGTFMEILNEVRRATMEAFDYQAYPFDELVDDLGLQRDISRSPLFDVMLVLQETDTGIGERGKELKDVKSNVTAETGTAVHKFDVTFNFIRSGEGLDLILQYNTDIYNRESIQRLGRHFEQLLRAIVQSPDLPAHRLDYLSHAEKEQLLIHFNDTTVPYNREKTVVSLFEDQVKATPNAVALVFEQTILTYAQLNNKVNQLAGYLRSNYSLQPDDLVALKLHRSEWLPVSLLAVLKAGAAYVPIDPEYPAERIEFMIRDCRCKLVIDSEELEKFRREEDNYGKNDRAPVNKPADLVYVIYTSGTTGNPKGVMIEHANLVARIHYYKTFYDLGPSDRMLFYRSYSFDGAVEEHLLPLLAGARCYIAPGGFKDDLVNHLMTFIHSNKITKVNMPPALLSEFVQAADPDTIEKMSSLRHIVSGGDKLTKKIISDLCSKFSAKLYNSYGPTENTIDSTNWTAHADIPDGKVPIGKPVPNSHAFVLDEELQLAPVGVYGELYLGGAGLARGYLYHPELTAQRFVTNPFQEGGRIYRSGDMVRWLPDGNLEFVGRKDDQVKIRGHRVELGEIEAALLRHPDIRATVVTAREDAAAGKKLAAYVVQEGHLDAAGLRKWLGGILPGYMLPAQFIRLAALPVTSNGKVDKKALPEPDDLDTGSADTYVAPVTEAQRLLTAVCQEVLKKGPIGVKDDFFVLGGDSIKSIQIVSRLKQKGYSLAVRDVLLFPVMEDLAGRMVLSHRQAGQDIVEGIVPLSPIQKAFLYDGEVDKHHFNQSVLLVSKGQLSVEALTAALNKIILHHDALRMVYQPAAEGWGQINRGKELGYAFEMPDAPDERSFSAHCDRIQCSFDPGQGPLFKAALFRRPEGDRLLLTAHHLIVDGVSWRILFEDLSALYQQYLHGRVLTLPLKTDSFATWQRRLLEYAGSNTLQQETAYWDAVEASAPDALPKDYPHGRNMLEDTSAVSFSLDAHLTQRLITQCYKAYRTPIDDLLVSGLYRALRQAFGIRTIAICMEGHGREQIDPDLDVSRTVGWFTSQYPVVLDSDADGSIPCLIAVKEVLHRVPNKGIGYGILRWLGGKDYLLTPEITFNYLGDFGSGVNTAYNDTLFEFSDAYRGIEISPQRHRGCSLNVSGMIVDGKISMSISYSAVQYKETTIQRLCTLYREALVDLIDQLSNVKVSRLTPVDLTYQALTRPQLSGLLEKHPVEDVYPLSPLQEGLYFHWLKAPADAMYFEQVAYRVKSELDMGVLDQSYQLLLERHSILRTVFSSDLAEIPLQIVVKDVKGSLRHHDFTGQPDDKVQAFKTMDIKEGFDLHRTSPVRLSILKVGEDVYEFIWSHHHILMDGWCGSILIRDFFRIYYALIRGKTPALAPVHPYSGYISWLMTREKEPSLSFWRRYLGGYESVSVLPKAHSIDHRDYQGRQCSFFLEGPVRTSITRLCAECGITENTFIQTMWGILLGRLNNTDDVVFGAVVSGRPPELPGVEEMVGLFINTIPVRVRKDRSSTVRQLLKEMQQNAIAGVDHHFTQLAEIQSMTPLGRNLFDHIIVFENYPVQEMILQSLDDAAGNNGLNVVSFDVFEQSNYDFSIMVVPGEKIMICFNYNTSVYETSLIERIREYFTRIVEEALHDPDRLAGKIDMLSKEETVRLLVGFNDFYVAYPAGATLSGLFEAQSASTPDNTALCTGTVTLTYRELNEKANQLCHYLRESRGIQKGSIVGIRHPRNEWLVISILAVLKSGAAYVPIDPDYPEERIHYMIEDSKAAVVLDEKELGAFRDVQPRYGKDTPVGGPEEQDLAYIIYTSGSTGKPKGVAIEHAAIVNTIRSQQEVFDVWRGEKHLQFSSPSFDASVSEIFVALASGGELWMIGDVYKKDPDLFQNYIKDNHIDIATIPPAYLKMLDIDQLHLRTLITAGEAALADKAVSFSQRGQYMNAYGPTESSICAAVFRPGLPLPAGTGNIPVGKPIANTQLYILDDHMNPMPLGIVGEIYIGGRGLSRGYINKPELSLEKFVPDPFKENGRLYRTGDLGRWLPDGNMEFISRKDHQVKIRGHRIEPGEIEAVLQSHPAVRSSVVVALEDVRGDRNLTAYIVPEGKVTTSDLRAYVSNLLPEFMMPAYFLLLDELPLTVNGKLDRSRLPDPTDNVLGDSTSYIPPRNELEEKLIAIWKELLGKEKIGIQDNFFEAGGNSIRIMRLSKMAGKLLGKEVSVALLFQYPNIRELIDYFTEKPVHQEAVLDRNEIIEDLNKFNLN